MQGEIRATVGQRLLWVLDRYRGSSGALNCPALCDIQGAMQIPRLQEALAQVVVAHSALRTIVRPDRNLMQSFGGAPAPAALQIKELRCRDSEHASRIVSDDLQRRVDPTQSPWRVTLITTAPDAYVLLINVHHIVTDLVGSLTLLEDLAAALAGAQIAATPGLSWDSIRYSLWEQQQYQQDGFARQQRYWFERLAGMRPLRTRLNPARDDRCGSKGLIEGTIDEPTRMLLDAIARGCGATPFACLLAVLFADAYLETGERDLSIASLIANRSRRELQRTIAFLVNIVVLRVRVRDRPTFADFVEHCQRAIAGALQNADLPFHALSPAPPRIRTHDNARVDDVVFHVIPEPIERVIAAGANALRIRVPEVIGRFDLEIAIRPARNAYVVRVTYNTSRLDPADAARLLQRYLDAASYVAASPDARLCSAQS